MLYHGTWISLTAPGSHSSLLTQCFEDRQVERGLALVSGRQGRQAGLLRRIARVCYSIQTHHWDENLQLM